MMKLVVKVLLLCSVIYFSGLFIANKVISNNDTIQAIKITNELSVQCQKDNVTYCD